MLMAKILVNQRYQQPTIMRLMKILQMSMLLNLADSVLANLDMVNPNPNQMLTISQNSLVALWIASGRDPQAALNKIGTM